MRFRDLLSVVLSVPILGAFGFDMSRYDNVAMYWGQNSRGTANPNETAGYQNSLSYYCRDNSTDTIPIAFLNDFFSTGGLPELNLANICNHLNNGTFPGTSLPKCKKLSSDIKTCQEKGKLVTLSLGGAVGNVSFIGDDQAKKFADTIWNLFLGGSSDMRPFGDAILDGIDLDIETGTSTGYAAFVNRIRFLAKGAKKKYYVTASPQCSFPDTIMGSILNTTWFDAVYVQFYDNPCGLQNFNSPSDWNYPIWDYWARNVSPNKNVRVYVGAYGASPGTAGSGYVSLSTLASIAVQMRKSYPSFGGVALWDASLAYANGRYDLNAKNALKAAGGVGFMHPACSAYAYVPGQAYSGGQQVTYDGYMWEAKWWTNRPPYHYSLGEWFAVSACQGTPPAQPSSSLSNPDASSSGLPGGALNNGEKSIRREREYFRNIWLGFLVLLL